MDSDRFDCPVENSGLDVAPRRVENSIKQGEFQYVRRGIGQSARVPWPQCWQPRWLRAACNKNNVLVGMNLGGSPMRRRFLLRLPHACVGEPSRARAVLADPFVFLTRVGVNHSN
jgi:hypothetical protein